MLVSFSDRHSPEIVTQTGINCFNRESVKQQVYFGLSKFFSPKVASNVGNPREIKALLQSLISKKRPIKKCFSAPSCRMQPSQDKLSKARTNQNFGCPGISEPNYQHKNVNSFATLSLINLSNNYACLRFYHLISRPHARLMPITIILIKCQVAVR